MKTNQLIEFQQKKEVYIPLDNNGQIIYKVNKLGKWSLRIMSSVLGFFETYQLSSGFYYDGWNGLELIDIIGLAVAIVPTILYPSFLFKPKKAWPFKFICFEKEELIFNFKWKTTNIRYDNIVRFQCFTHGISASSIEFILKDGSSKTAAWFPTNENKKQLEIRLSIQDELNKRINDQKNAVSTTLK